MRSYFLLRYRMLLRGISEFGLPPAAGLVLAALGFIGLSWLLFAKTEYAPYILVALALGLISSLGEPGRNDFLATIFPARDYRIVRITENLALAAPFILALTVRGAYLPAGLLALLAPVMALSRYSVRFAIAIPTPFGKRPFEFPAGFRKSWPFLAAAIILAGISGPAGNFNLGIFALLLVMAVAFTFYLDPEDPSFVWIFACSPARFLAAKIRTALLFSLLLALPVLVILALYFPGHLLPVLGIQAACCLYLVAVIVAKYASFPGQVSLPAFVLLAFSVTFPPLLAVLIPWFWMRSVHRLKDILA